MVNRHRGELSVEINGQTETLCLTLGALAELEDLYGGKSILALVDQFASKGMCAVDVSNVLRAGLVGSGREFTQADLSIARFEGGFVGAARAAATLLKISFGEAEAGTSNSMNREVIDETIPFHGKD